MSKHRYHNKHQIAGIFCCLVFLCCFSFPGTAGAQPVRSNEYGVKAAFLFNFTRFVEWPETSFQSDGSPFVIGIVGKDPFGETIDQTIAGESVNGHPIIIQRYKDWNSLRNCHILFVSARQLPDIKRRLRQLKGRPMLTVSDHPGFITYGGMIRFLLDNNKIKIQINPAAARAESLNISSKLLRLADIAEARQ